MLNTVKFVWDITWVLPKLGKFEFEFLYFENRPLNADDETQDWDKVCEWFELQGKQLNP